MGVSGAGGGYIGQEIVRTQGATALRVGSSGEIVFEPGGEQAGLTGDILIDLSQGVVSSASGARGLFASAVNPSWHPVNGTTDPLGRLRWTSAAGTTTPVWFPPVMLPDDVDILHPMVLRLFGEGSSAQSTNEVAAGVFFGVGGTNRGSTISFTSTPSERTLSIASGGLASAGPLTLIIAPAAHASGSIDLFAAKFTYKRRSRST